MFEEEMFRSVRDQRRERVARSDVGRSADRHLGQTSGNKNIQDRRRQHWKRCVEYLSQQQQQIHR